MPRIHQIKERYDLPLYDTHVLEPGQEARLLDNPEHIGDMTKTNVQKPGMLHYDNTFIVGSIGLRLVGKTQEEEERLLDHLFATVIIGDKPYGPYPGNLCSTWRLLEESEKAAAAAMATGDEPMEVTDESHKSLMENLVFNFSLLPGHVLLRPLILPVRQRISMEVQAATTLPETVLVRGFLLGLRTRDIN